MKYQLLFGEKVVDEFRSYKKCRMECERCLRFSSANIYVVSIGKGKHYYQVSLKKRIAKNYNKDKIVLRKINKSDLK